MRLPICILLALFLMPAPASRAAQPLRLADHRPFTCVYYFPQWWDPWKSDDQAIADNFQYFRQIGINVIGVDHEWSQMIDRDWYWLDRTHRLAKAAGIQIIPWLSLKVWSDMGYGTRPQTVKSMYGVDLKFTQLQDGSQGGLLIWDEATLVAGTQYTVDYIDRYQDQALLHVDWNGESRPVVALSVEMAWEGGFDPETTARFITWLRTLYHDDLGALNAAWQTTYGKWTYIDPKNTTVFDYANHQAKTDAHPQAVEDHIEFRSQTISGSLAEMARRVRLVHPEVLILAEVPYQFKGLHHDAEAFRIQYGCNPSCTLSADIIWFRATDYMAPSEVSFVQQWMAQTGQPLILTQRTYSSWGDSSLTEAQVNLYADRYAQQAADIASGFGFYSWNEMVDTHVVPSDGFSEADSQRAIHFLATSAAFYLEHLKAYNTAALGWGNFH